MTLTMLLTCQPPRIEESAPLVSQRLPLPKGSSAMFEICRLWVRSKLLIERFRP
jgi:hypothetical protein